MICHNTINNSVIKDTLFYLDYNNLSQKNLPLNFDSQNVILGILYIEESNSILVYSKSTIKSFDPSNNYAILGEHNLESYLNYKPIYVLKVIYYNPII